MHNYSQDNCPEDLRKPPKTKRQKVANDEVVDRIVLRVFNNVVSIYVKYSIKNTERRHQHQQIHIFT